MTFSETLIELGKGKIINICTVQECNKRHHAKGYCSMHYKRLLDNGTTDKLLRKPVWNKGTRGICKVDNCNVPNARQGYCNRHALRMDKYGTTDLPKREPEKCSVEGCENEYCANGYCRLHDRRVKRNGTPILQEKEQRFCSIEGCGKKHNGNGYCAMHRARWKRWGDPMKVGSCKGKKATYETKQKQREAKLDKTQEWYESQGKNHPRKDKKHTEETKNNIRLKKYLNPTHIFYNTRPERFMKSILTINGIIYESQKNIYGTPDIFIEPNICVFVDGNHYHADPKKYKANDKITNTNKIAKQIWERDTRVNNYLRNNGYIVIRFWEKEIYQNPIKCLEKIKEVMS